jgi:trk system potassium uptake protein TrkA
MTAKRRIAVIGLNTFGHALMHSLTEHGLDCLGLDISRDVVQVMASEFPSVLEVDATYEDALIEAGVREYDLAVVTLGTDIAASVLATLAAKNVGVPQVAAKARDNQHAEVLRKVGADIIIFNHSGLLARESGAARGDGGRAAAPVGAALAFPAKPCID